MALHDLEWGGEVIVLFEYFSHILAKDGVEVVFDFVVVLGAEVLCDFRPSVSVFGVEYEEVDFLVLSPYFIVGTGELHNC